MLVHTLFPIFVAVAVYAQNQTGFAFALILLGLVGLTDLVPLPDAANAVTVLIIVNALTFFCSRKAAHVERAIIPAVVTSLVGTVVGMALLTFLAANAYQVLRMILGLSVLICAILLWRSAKLFCTTSTAGYFAFVGSLSGVLGGLFSAAGPPLVYAVYRQPWPQKRIQDSLIFTFGVSAVLRLVVIAGAGHFSRLAMILAAEAVPVTLLVTSFNARRAPPISKVAMKNVVCILLGMSGFGILISSIQALMG